MAHLRREVRDVVVEGDRRRFSMLVERILDPNLYLCALSDFLLTIARTMEEDRRPMRENGRAGKFIKFSEGILCQNKVVFPGLECKLSTGNVEYSGWFAATLFYFFS